MTFEEEMKNRAERVDRLLDAYLPKKEGPDALLYETMRYAVTAGGKRLRPILLEETYHIFGGRGTMEEPFMAAVEMIHTYSLIHDDLPAMDDDDYRRGRQTTHKVYGEAMGILAGDGLQNLAFETVSEAVLLHPHNPSAARAMAVLAQKAGPSGMIGGQAIDVSATEGKENLCAEEILLMYKKKTSALLEASVMIGAILAEAEQEEVDAMERIAEKIGLAFQIKDDILDITGDFASLGKPIGSDAAGQKITYATLVGLQAAEEKAKELTKEAVIELRGLRADTAFLQELFLYLTKRDR